MSNTVFKILLKADWAAAQNNGFYQGSGDDLRDGFIHLSTDRQVAGTLKRHFKGQTDLVIVAFCAETLGPELRYEASRNGDLFPHLYAALPASSAIWSRQLLTDSDGEPICPEDWLTTC